MLRNDLVGSECLYPFGPGGSGRDVPAIMSVTLLSEDPEALWDELVPAVRSRKRDTLAGHYRWFFEWLAHRFERDVWIERSAGSLLLVPALARLFPDARFVHLYRDGRDTAMSMQRHMTFRVYAVACGLMWRLGRDPFKPANWAGTSLWRPWLIRLTSILFSRKRFLARDVYRMWSNMIERGTWPNFPRTGCSHALRIAANLRATSWAVSSISSDPSSPTRMARQRLSCPARGRRVGCA